MPRIDFKLWNRVYILKLICTIQMTYSSFITLVYFYLIILQSWTTWESERPGVLRFKWGVIVASALEFGLGTLLAFAANMTGVSCKRRIIAWLILETFLVPISICLLMQLYYRIVYSTLKYSTDPHYSRTNIAQVCFLLCQYGFIAYALDFLTHAEQKPKLYDPSIRPESVYAPTDPQITTTESRHIRISQSLLFQPSSSRGVKINNTGDDESNISLNENKLSSEEREWRNRERDSNEWVRDNDRSRLDEKHLKGEEKIWMADDSTVWSKNDSEYAENSGKPEKNEENEWKNYESNEWTGNIQRADGEKHCVDVERHENL